MGDFEHDADAAYRAKQVLEHIEVMDESGGRLAGKDVNNGRVDGFTKSGQAKHGTKRAACKTSASTVFGNLKGELKHIDAVGDDPGAREAGEAVGIVWQRPEGDERSAQDIIDNNPLLKHLGNQSGVKDRLKEQVGDFENDPDAAFRAAQVMDRIVSYDENSKLADRNTVSNSSVDGFTKSGEAKHADRGRFVFRTSASTGFSALPKAQAASDIASYKDFLKANPKTDEGAKKIAQYAAILDQQYDVIRAKTGKRGHSHRREPQELPQG